MNNPVDQPKVSERTHRHVKRGSDYVLIGFGTWMSPDPVADDADAYVEQVAPGVWHVRGFASSGREWARTQCNGEISQGAVLAIYRSVADASLWVRPREEFEDGRFLVLPQPQATTVTDAMVERLYEYVRALGFHGPDAKPYSARSDEHQAKWRAALEAALIGIPGAEKLVGWINGEREILCAWLSSYIIDLKQDHVRNVDVILRLERLNSLLSSGAEKGEAVAWRVYDASQQSWSFTTVEPSAPSPASLSKVEPLYAAPTSDREQALEEAAALAESMHEIIPMWERPGGPPGNGPNRRATPVEIANAIRALNHKSF